nr:MOSC domain-containing protein [Cellulosimicrobium sp. JZ28]
MRGWCHAGPASRARDPRREGPSAADAGRRVGRGRGGQGPRRRPVPRVEAPARDDPDAHRPRGRLRGPRAQEIDPGLTRRNVTLTHGDLPTKPGSFLRIGDVELQVLRIAAPCRLLDDWIAPGAMRAMHARGGVVCRLLSSGTVRAGDVVVWDEAGARGV